MFYASGLRRPPQAAWRQDAAVDALITERFGGLLEIEFLKTPGSSF